jgi:hypothetical protein
MAGNDASGLATAHGAYSTPGKGSVFKVTPANDTPDAATASLLTMSAVNAMSNFGVPASGANTCTNGTKSGTGCWSDGGSWFVDGGIAFNGKLVYSRMRGLARWGPGPTRRSKFLRIMARRGLLIRTTPVGRHRSSSNAVYDSHVAGGARLTTAAL